MKVHFRKKEIIHFSCDRGIQSDAKRKGQDRPTHFLILSKRVSFLLATFYTARAFHWKKKSVLSQCMDSNTHTGPSCSKRR